MGFRSETRRDRALSYVILFLAVVSCSPDSGSGLEGPVGCEKKEELPRATIATFNIHAGVGRDGKRDLNRIAVTLRGTDLVGLQEVDNGRLRSGFANQARSIAAALGHRYWQHFAVEDYWPFGAYGLAASSSFPVLASTTVDLPIVEGKPRRRLAWIKVLVGCRPLHVFLAHLTRADDPSVASRNPQTYAVWWRISEKLKDSNEPAILMGDFNAGRESESLMWLRKRMFDVIESQGLQRSDLTLLDRIFVTGNITILKAEVRDNPASDHPAIVATLQLNAH